MSIFCIKINAKIWQARDNTYTVKSVMWKCSRWIIYSQGACLICRSLFVYWLMRFLLSESLHCWLSLHIQSVMRSAAPVSRDLACTVATRRTTTATTTTYIVRTASPQQRHPAATPSQPTVCQMTVPSRTECDAYNALWRYNRTVRTGRQSFQFGWSGQPTSVETCPVCRLVGCLPLSVVR